jgi:uncharacterized protein YeaO (DUF488 family)
MATSLRLRVKRIYDSPSPQDGHRFLVDRLWPRGLKKEACELDGWLKEVAPSDGLRRRFGHDPAHWDEFQRRYFEELEKQPDACREIVEKARSKTVTLLYAARDTEHNNAVALKMYLEKSHRFERIG